MTVTPPVRPASEVDRVAEAHLEAVCRLDPVAATSMGVAGHDGEVPDLGRYSARRRVARANDLGSAPTTATSHRGLEDRRVKLGRVPPGESPATYLHADGPRHW